MPGEKKTGDINITMGDGNVVGDVGHKFYETPRRHLTEGMKQQLLAGLPSGRAFKIDSPAGDGEALDYAIEIENFLQANGFPLAPGGSTMSMTIPGHRPSVHINIASDPMMIRVGPRS